MAEPERDLHSGKFTTGHEWNGIRELNTPVPKIFLLFLILSIVFAVVWWVLFPAWPTGDDYTKGLVGQDQALRVEEDLERADKARRSWTKTFEERDVAWLQSDKIAMGHVRSTGARLYSDNCALCHGPSGEGARGFPSLVDDQWLWGSGAETILETLRVGINSGASESRASVMPAFGRSGMLTSEQIRDVSEYVRSLSTAEPQLSGNGAQLFAEQCAACHGSDAKGLKAIGSANLTDDFWIYGGDARSVAETLKNGRQGVMPHWEDRLTLAERKMLTLYVLDFERGVK